MKMMLWRASEIRGSAVEAADGSIGSVEDLLFSEDNWIIRWAVIDTGNWLPGRQVLLPPARLTLPNEKSGTLTVPLTKKAVEDAPEIDRDPPVSRQQEMRIYSHYGWSPYWAPVETSAALNKPSFVTPTVEPRPIQNGDPTLQNVQEVTGYYIHARDGDIGHVEDFLIATPGWVIRYLIVDTKNWWPGKHVLVAPEWAAGISWSEQTVTLDMTREIIEQAPEYDADTIIDCPYVERLFQHYQRPRYWQVLLKLPVLADGRRRIGLCHSKRRPLVRARYRQAVA
jgi:hypothetical protein